MTFEDEAAAELAQLAAAGLRRTRRTRAGSLDGDVALGAGPPLLDFASNDYLGLAADPRLAAAAAAAAARYGTGAGASRLVIGDTGAHAAFEDAVATWLGAPRVLSMPSGYAANSGVVAALATRGTVVFSDELNHASIIDGCRLGRGQVVVYRHGDLADLAAKLGAAPRGRRLVVSESLFSMDGDIVDVAGLAALCKVAGAALMLDEAHALGVVGPDGRGVAAAVGVVPDILIGTLGKAFGSAGAFVATTPALAELLWQHARPHVFSTGLPPMVMAAAHAGLDIIASSDGAARRVAVAAAAAQVRAAVGARAGDLPSPIVPVIVGDDQRAVDRSAALAGAGVLVPAIRPPTVPVGTARLRISLSARHDAAALARLLDGLAATA